jgi:hypothetical protein
MQYTNEIFAFKEWPKAQIYLIVYLGTSTTNMSKTSQISTRERG